jgi:hypothetical protein
MTRFAALLVLLLTLPAHAFMLKGGSGSPPSGGTVVGTVDFYNNNATTVNGPIPVQSGIYFGPGVVPSGQSVVPSVGGVQLTQWECTSEALNWPDGSFRGCSFSGFLPNSITAGSREQVTWTLTSGSMPSITPANPSEVTGASNFHQDFTNASGASQSTGAVPYGLTVGVVVGSGGTLTATALQQQPLLGASCGSGANCGGLIVSITGCSVAPTVSFTSTGGSPNLVASAAVASAGSGCPVTGSGAWSFQVNSILAAAGSSVPLCTSQTANAQVCQYSGSNVKDGFKVWGYYVDTGKPAWAATTVYASNSTVLSKGNAYTNASGCTSGSTAPTGVTAGVSDGGCTWSTVIGWEQGVADIEYWKTSGGSLYGFNVATESDDGIYKATTTIPPHSFSSDLYDGSLDLRGAANDTGFVGINQLGNGGAWYTVDTEGLPIWDIGNSTANSPALNRVVVSLTTADKVYFHKNHAVPPLQQVTLSGFLTLTRNNTANLGNMTEDFSTYVPLCFCDVDEQGGIANGGSHAWDSVVTEANAAWYEVVDSASDGGWSWLGNSRLGALAAAGSWGGPSEPLTHHAVNWIPTIAWTPPANFTDPVRPNATIASGYTGFDMNVTQQALASPNNQHFGSWSRFIYVVEGRRYMLDELDLAFRQMQMQQYPPTDRLATFGGTTYYSETNDLSPRANAWYLYNTAMAAIFLNQESDGQYAYKQWHDGYTEMAAYVPFVGSGTFGVGSTPFQKCADWTPIGVQIASSTLSGANCSTIAGGALGGAEWFNLAYLAYVTENDAMLNDGAISAIDAVNATSTGGLVQNADQCIYLTPPYAYQFFTNPYTQTIISTTDATTVAATSRPSLPGGRLSNMLQWTAGNSTFTASVTPTAGDENWFAKPTAAISGTTLALDMAVGVAGSQVYDMSVPADVGVDTFVNGGSPPSASVTVNQAVSVPAPVTTTINSITSSSVLVVAPPGAGSIEIGDTVVDTTNPSAIASSYTNFSENVTVSAISGSGPFTVTLMADGSPCGGQCAPTNGDTVKFAHMLGFSSRYDYPDTGLLPAAAGSPLPNGSFICLTNYTMGDATSPGDHTIGTYPPTTSAGGTLTNGQCFVATEVGASGTAWTLTTLSTASPPNTVVVPSSTGQGPGGYIPNAACPAAVKGEIQQGGGDYQNPVSRIAQQYGFTNFAAALGINSGAANSAVTLMAPYQTPLSTVYGPSAGSQYFLLDNHF